MKTRGGRSTVSGITAQSWAAMSLFLQYIERSDFSYIGFEGEKLEDFHLVFSNGKKMICESKDKQLNYSDVRNILEKIYQHGQASQKDDIIIICKSVNRKLKSDFENYKYFTKETSKRLTAAPHNFTKNQLQYIPQVKFWEVPQDMNERIVRIILARLLKVWVPERRLEEIKDHLVLQEVFHGSAVGKLINKEDFIKKLNAKKLDILEDAGYEAERQTAENDVKELLRLVENESDVKIVPNKISDISRKPSEFFYLLMKLKDKKDLSLKKWDVVWNASLHSFLSIHLFDIFKNNLHTKQNREYAINFVNKVLDQGYNLFREEYVKTDIADLCQGILEKDRAFEKNVLEIVKKLFSPDISDFFFKERTQFNDRHEWEREKFSELIKNLYETSDDKEVKKQTITYLENAFNLVQDNGEYWHYTPPAIFSIFKDELLQASSLEEKIIWFKNLCIAHYDNFHRRFDSKWAFGGWELSGSGISQNGSSYSIGDNHFVSMILKPALDKIYEQDGWKFIIEECISRKIDDVSREKPDFLNRAALPILFKEYKNGKHQKEAFGILSDFVKMRRGIPWKADLIFQELKGDYSDKQKWDLVKVSLDEFKNLPVNVFVEQIVSDLAKKKHKLAIKALNDWVKDPEYDKRNGFGTGKVIENLPKILNNPKTFAEGVKIFREYIFNKNFIEESNDWGAWDVAKVLSNITTVKPSVGISLLNEIADSQILTHNQQTLITSSLNDLPKENKVVLGKIYRSFLYPFLKKLDFDISKVEKRLPNRYSREQIVQFADKIGEAGFWKEAFFLVNIFIEDSDPIIGNYPDDDKGAFNEHKRIIEGEYDFTIRTVRGWCAWVLQKLVVPRDSKRIQETRDLIEKAVPLVKQLSMDENYYVRAQATIPLLELAKNKNTVLPNNSKERFIPIVTAREISDIAFAMLRDETNQTLPGVMKHMAMVFSYMRSLTQEEAKEVLQIFLKDTYPQKTKERGKDAYLADVLNEAASLYIFFAEFRKNSFKNWPAAWDDLGNFNDQPFKDLLKSLMNHDNPEIRRIFSWQIARLPDELKNKPQFDDILQVSAGYLKLATSQYDHHAFESIYRFVEDYIFDDRYFDMAVELWEACILTEVEFFKDNYSEDKMHEMYWWPFHYNGKILVRIANIKGAEALIRWLNILLEYPIDVLLAYDLDIAIEELVKVKDEEYKNEINKIFDKLIARSPKYFEHKQRWLK